MKKIILDLRTIKNREELYDIIAERFDFPDYFGRNLDALYDCLTEICEDTCVGLFLPEARADEEDVLFTDYLEKLRRTFEDAEEENAHVCVIIAVT